METKAPAREKIEHESRSLILQVALDLFTRKGYDGTSIDDIREAAGFKSKASLYTHFKSKEEVARALLEKWQGEQERNLLRAYQNSPDSPLPRFVAMGRAFIEWGLTHPPEYAFCFMRVQQEKLMRGEYDYLSGQRYDPTYGLMLELLRRLRETHPVRPIADAALLSMLVGMISKAVIDQESFGPVSLSQRADQLMEMAFGLIFSEKVALPG